MAKQKHDVGAMAVRIELLVRRALDRDDADKARRWYADAKAWCQTIARDLRVPLSTVVGFVAAMSPRNSWEGQKRTTHAQLTAALLGKSIPGAGTNANKRKAQSCADGVWPLEVLGGSKVRSFFNAIMTGGQCPDVVIDVHAWAAATGKRDGVVTATGYRAASDAFRRVAATMRTTPCEAQALAWVEWRRLPLEGVTVKGAN